MKPLKRRTEGLSLSDPDYSAMQPQLAIIGRLASGNCDTVLDYGAGNSPYRHLFNCRRYITADVEQNESNSIDILLDKQHPALPLAPGSVDIVLCMDVLEHVPDDKALLQLLHGVLKPGGTLILGIPFIYREHEYPNDFRRYTSAGIERLLIGHNFSILSLNKLGNAFYVAAGLLYERMIMNGEIDRSGIAERALRKLYRMFIPLLNLTLFSIGCRQDAGVFSRILTIATKPSGEQS